MGFSQDKRKCRGFVLASERHKQWLSLIWSLMPLMGEAATSQSGLHVGWKRVVLWERWQTGLATTVKSKRGPFGQGRASLGRKNIFISYPPNSTGAVTRRQQHYIRICYQPSPEVSGFSKSFLVTAACSSCTQPGSLAVLDCPALGDHGKDSSLKEKGQRDASLSFQTGRRPLFALTVIKGKHKDKFFFLWEQSVYRELGVTLASRPQ